MKSRLEEVDGKIREAVSEKKTVSDFYASYENQMKSDYQVLLEQAKGDFILLDLLKNYLTKDLEELCDYMFEI